MPVEDEFGLPRPPLPRPVRREAAIEAALRKFDGAESHDPSRKERPRPSWGIVHRPHLAVAVSAALLLVVGIPAAFIGLRDQPRSSDRAPTEVLPRQVECVGKTCVTQAPPAQRSPAPEASVTENAPPPDAALKASTARQENRASDAAQPAVSEPRAKATSPAAPPLAAPAPQAAPALAAAPPPPPPPPPPPSPVPRAVAERDSLEPSAQDIVISGTRIRTPEGRGVANEKAARAAPLNVINEPALKSASDDARLYSAFLSRLKAAVSANDTPAIVRLIAFPLRVNGQSGTRMYRNARAVERDFDRIFTGKVRRAILDQSPGRLFVRDQGAMVGSGEIWFAQTCRNRACSSAGEVRITAVNP